MMLSHSGHGYSDQQNTQQHGTVLMQNHRYDVNGAEVIRDIFKLLFLVLSVCGPYMLVDYILRGWPSSILGGMLGVDTSWLPYKKNRTHDVYQDKADTTTKQDGWGVYIAYIVSIPFALIAVMYLLYIIDKQRSHGATIAGNMAYDWMVGDGQITPPLYQTPDNKPGETAKGDIDTNEKLKNISLEAKVTKELFKTSRELLDKQLKEKKEEVDRLKKEVAQLKEDKNKLEDKIKKYGEDEIKKNDKKKQELDIGKTLDNLNIGAGGVTKLESRIAKLEKQIKEEEQKYEKEMTEISNKLDEAEKTIKDRKKQIKQLEDKMKEKKESHENKIKQKDDELQSKLALARKEFDNDIANLKASMSGDIESNNKKLTDVTRTHMEEIKKLQDQIAENTNKAEEKYRQMSQEFEKKRTEIEKKNMEDHTKLQKKINDFENAIKRIGQGVRINQIVKEVIKNREMLRKGFDALNNGKVKEIIQYKRTNRPYAPNMSNLFKRLKK